MLAAFDSPLSEKIVNNDWIGFFLFLSVVLLLIALSELARKKLHWTTEATRKLVHLSVGLMMMVTPFVFHSKFPPVLLAVLFIMVNSVTFKSEKLRGIHSTDRKTYGTVYFPIAFLLLCLFWWNRPLVFEISLLLLAVADTMASMAGETVRSPDCYVMWKDEKSVQGSMTMFLSSIFLVGFGTFALRRIIGLPPLDISVIIPVSLFVAVLATIAEGVSHRGSDNLSVPLISAVAYDLFMTASENGELLTLLLWILASLFLALGALRFNALAVDGALGACVIGVLVFGIGKWKFMVPMALFFLLSSLLSKIGKRRRETTRTSFGKGSKRDVVQVFANGGVPLILTIWWFYSPSDWLYAAFVASIAAATADTWATEIGFFSRRPPRDSISFRTVEPGESGGVTLLGTLGGLAGSAVIALSGFAFLPDQSMMALVTVAGFVASLVDSVLGATIQGVYQCTTCRMKTELATHCNSPVALLRGSRFISNDAVNLLCTLSGGAIILLAG